MIAGFHWPANSALAFVHHQGTEEYWSGSYSNPKEIELMWKVLKPMLRAGAVKPWEVALLTPYTMQKEALQETIILLQARHDDRFY